MTTPFDVIVVGLGGMGSAAAYQLAGRGVRVLGLDRNPPAHNLGSSHGQSRIIRQAYYEHPAYVPLLLRAYELWQQLERETNTQLLRITGGVMIGSPDSHVVAGSIRSAREYGLDHEILDAAEIKRRFPPLTPQASDIALYERQGGVLDPEATVRAHLDRAATLGAKLHFEESVLNWEASASGEGVRVTTACGSYNAARLIIAPGAWAPALLRDLGLPLRVERRVMYWFDPVGGRAAFQPDRFPIYIWEVENGISFYGFPELPGTLSGLKVALHTLPGDVCTPETINRSVHAHEIARIRGALAERIPALSAGAFVAAATCMYTLTPDQHFVIGMHPQHAQVVIASPCSGHGYKFASVVGEILADLAQQGTTRHPIELFAPTRFG